MREKLTVLLIEDNPGDARLIREFLVLSGGSFYVEVADRLSTGLARLEAQTMDAILLDLSLPDSSGFDTFARLHAQAPRTPIIVLTGLDDEALAEAAVRAGAQDYLVKGQVDGNLLARSIRYAVERKRAEEALHESEARYRALFESARDAIFIMDYDHFIDCNLPAMKLFGGDRVSVIGQPPYEVFSPPAQPDGRPSKDSALEKIEAALGGVAQFFEWKHRRIDGDLFDAEVSLSQVEIGHRFYLQAIVRDITTRKQAEIALAQERLLLRTVIDNLPDAIYAKDLHGRKMLANRADLDNIGKPEAEVLGKTDAELFPLQIAAHFKADDQTVLQAGQPVLNREELLVNREGRQIWQLTSKLPLKDVAGQIVGLVGIGRDITERKQAEAALRALSARQEALLAAIPDVIMEVNNDKVYTWANQAGLEFFGEEVLGKEAAFYFEGEQATYTVVRPLFNGAESTIYVESWQRRKDGQKRLLAWWCRVLKDDQGNPTGALSSARDITEHEQMEKALQDRVIALQTLAEIDREIIAATEPQGILNLVCRRATELVHAQKSAIALETSVDGMALAASYGLRDPVMARREFTRHWQAESLRPNSPDAQQSIALNDVSASSPYMPEFSAREEIRAVATIPLVVGEARLGVLVVFDTQLREWTADELQTLDMLAGQTAVALEKVRLYRAAQDRAAQLAMLNDIGQALTSTLDLDRVLALLLDKARHSIGAEACSVALMEAPSGDLVYRQAVGQAAQSVVGVRLQSGQGIAGWVAAQRQSALVTDAASDPRFYQRVDGDSGFATRDVVCVPLVARDAVVGVIELLNKTNGRFDSDDVRLLESVAAQAAIAIENARLFETESAGRQRLQTLYRIGQTLNSTLNAEVILDRLTDEAMRVTQATHGAALVARPDLGYFERRSLRGFSPELAEQARTTPLSLERGVNGRAYQQRRPVYVRDVRTDPEYVALIPETRSELAVPVMRGGQVIANLDLQSPQVGGFDAVDLDFMQALTDQVAVALENARLFEEAHRRLDEMAIVSQVALTGAAGRPFDDAVARAAAAMSSLWPDSNVSFLFMDETGLALQMHPACWGVAPDLAAALRIPLDRGVTGWVFRERQPVRIGNVNADRRYVVGVPGAHSEMAAPLAVGERVIGVVNVESPRPDAYSGDDLRVLMTLAGQLATIFEKARLDAELADYTATLERRVEGRTAEIRQQQAHTQAILDAVGEGVIVTNLDGDIQYVNSAAENLTGYSAAESIGQNPRLWQSGQTPLEIYQAMWNAMLAGQTWHGEIVNRNKHNVLYEALLTIAPIRSALDSRQPAGFVGVQRDISEIKRAEEEMRRALEKERELGNLKSSFVSLTSHEFRTPLTTILSSAEMLEHYGPKWTEERKREHSRRIQYAVKHMTSLLEDILVIGKAEADKMEFAPAPLDLVQFCRELADGLQLADSGRHELVFSSRGECAQANMDESLLRHILSNLLSNAIKYSPPKSRVLFDLVCQDGQAVFQVQDSGIGIPPEDQLRLFETFHRAGNVRNIPGTGLGMAIAKRSVDLHGGEIKVESQVGVGTKITVTLPLGTGAGV